MAVDIKNTNALMLGGIVICWWIHLSRVPMSQHIENGIFSWIPSRRDTGILRCKAEPLRRFSSARPDGYPTPRSSIATRRESCFSPPPKFSGGFTIKVASRNSINAVFAFLDGVPGRREATSGKCMATAPPKPARRDQPHRLQPSACRGAICSTIPIDLSVQRNFFDQCNQYNYRISPSSSR